jgi:hypothetical protein
MVAYECPKAFSILTHSFFCLIRKLQCMCCISLRSGAVSRSCGGLVYPPEYMLNSLLLSDRLLVKDDLVHVVQECLGCFCTEKFLIFATEQEQTTFFIRSRYNFIFKGTTLCLELWLRWRICFSVTIVSFIF